MAIAKGIAPNIVKVIPIVSTPEVPEPPLAPIATKIRPTTIKRNPPQPITIKTFDLPLTPPEEDVPFIPPAGFFTCAAVLLLNFSRFRDTNSFKHSSEQVARKNRFRVYLLNSLPQIIHFTIFTLLMPLTPKIDAFPHNSLLE